MTQVMTVTGPVAADALGRTLMHEHLVVDAKAWAWQPPENWKAALHDTAVTPSLQWMLREDPFAVIDNCVLDDVEAAIEEVASFVADGGTTLVDPTCSSGMGRSPAALVDISRRTGLQVVMGAGWYLHPTHTPDVRDATVEELTDRLAAEINEGVDGTAIKPGLIGEIGVSAEFTDSEQRSLRAAARAQVASGLPLMVHLPGWERYAHRVLDMAADEGVDPRAVILCHMNPSGQDWQYQRSLAERGAWLEFDMVGMGYYYADQDGQSPSPEEDAHAVARLVGAGYGGQLLLSHDVFLKSMWTRYGGNGFSYVTRLFLPRLIRHGVEPVVAASMLDDNPRVVFETADLYSAANSKER